MGPMYIFSFRNILPKFSIAFNDEWNQHTRVVVGWYLALSSD